MSRSRPLFPLVSLLCLVPLTSLAQGLDASGFSAVPSGGQVTVPFGLWSPQNVSPSGGVFSARLEWIDQPIARAVRLYPLDVVQQIPLIQTLVGAQLSYRYAIIPRVEFAANLPVWGFSRGEQDFTGGTPAETGYAGGPALGDLGLALPVSLLHPKGASMGVRLIPTLRLPTGASGRFLGDSKSGGSLRLAGGFRTERLHVVANLGVQSRRSANPEVLSGSGWVGGLGLSLPLNNGWTPQTAVRFGSGLIAPSGEPIIPVEWTVGAQGDWTDSMTWNTGFGFGLTGAVGEPNLRLFAGLSYAVGDSGSTKRPLKESEGAVVLQTIFEVKDANGALIRGASIQQKGASIGLTDGRGRLILNKKQVKWRQGVEVQADGFIAKSVVQPENTDLISVEMEWKASRVKVWVHDETGQRVDAQVSLTQSKAAPTSLDETGRVQLVLVPGQWTVLVEAEGMGTQSREIQIRGFQPDISEIEVILLPEQSDAYAMLSVLVSEPSGRPIEGARVRIDGHPVGTTGTGGRVQIFGLQAANHRLEVIHDAFQALERDNLVLGDGVTSEQITLRRLPGSVKVIVTGPEGVVSDATVQFDGPSTLAPAELGADGERIFVVRPGEWDVLVFSPEWGVQSRRVVIPPDRTRLTVVEVALQSEGGQADYRVSVVDPDGVPVDAAQIVLDGNSLGYTSTGGEMKVRSLQVGARSVDLLAEHFRPRRNIEIFLVEGLQEQSHILDWMPGMTRVHVRSADGYVSDATALFTAGEDEKTLELGPFGEGILQLSSGEWQVLLISPSHGVQAREFQVPEDSRRLNQVEIVLDGLETGEADLKLVARTPLGDPAPGLEVSIDGNSVGTTGVDGRLVLYDIGEGDRSLELSAPLFQSVVNNTQLRTGENQVEVSLDWAPGAAIFTAVDSAGQPVLDAMIQLSGPKQVDGAQVDKKGRRFAALVPGEWQVLALSPTMGFLSKELVLAADTLGLTQVDFIFEVVDDSLAQVLLKVVDPDGEPIVGAVVDYNGASVRTGFGGRVLVEDLVPGVFSASVSAPFFTSNSLTGELQGGAQERLLTLDWKPIEVLIQVKDGSGAPVQAELRFDGPASVPPIQTDQDGRAQLSLRPGEWTVLASTDTLGVKSDALLLEVGEDSSEVFISLDAEARVSVTEQSVVIVDQVRFDLNSAQLKPGSFAILKEIADTLLSHPEVARVEIQGHTDSTGSLERNLTLSEERAQVVRAALIASGVAPERLLARGYGATRPLRTEHSAAARALNRRVQFTITDVAAHATKSHQAH